MNTLLIFLESLSRDLGHGIRILIHRPGFTLVAVLTLGLGIGAATALLSVVNRVLFKPLPYEAPERLALIWNEFRNQGQEIPQVSPPDLLDYREQARLFEGFAAAYGRPGSLTGNGEPEQVDVARVTANFLPLLGIEPIHGRNFLPEEDIPNGPRVVILAQGLWQRRFGKDPNLIGQSLQLNGAAYIVVGILPENFRLMMPAEVPLMKDPDLLIPAQVAPQAWGRNFNLLTVIGRLKPGVERAQAQTEMDGIAARLRREHLIHQSMGTHIRVALLHGDIVKNARPALTALSGGAVCLLLIACANVANLMLVRAAAREREFAVRSALGASRLRLVRQLLAEAVALALPGGVAGVLLAAWGLALLSASPPAWLPLVEEVGIDASALAVAAVVCCFSVLLFGLAPAWLGSRIELTPSLKGSGSVSSGSGRRQLRRLLIIAEVALALVLLISAGLLMRSFISLENTHPGFNAGGVYTFKLSIPAARYPTFNEISNFYRRLEEKLAALPGVEAVGSVNFLPLSGDGFQTAYAWDEETERNWESMSADRRNVTRDYFEVMGIQLRAGRLFDDRDTADKPFVVMVDETLAQRAWPGEHPIGKRIKCEFRMGNGQAVEARWGEVIGVVAHVRNHKLTEHVREQIYYSFLQQPSALMSVALRSAVTPANLHRAIRREVKALDADLPLYDERPMKEYASRATAPTRFTLTLVGLFGALALVLAAVGLYGLISCSVAQRAHEIGIRMALGASPRQVLMMVLGEGSVLTLVGIGAGLGAALLLTRYLSSLIFGVGATDPATFAAVSGGLLVVAVLACYVPARRATRVDPLVALKCE